jgi:alkylation response protein AidB-like acyl-CoA dehydrogenase
VLSGQKYYISGVDLADAILVVTRVSPGCCGSSLSAGK